MKLPIAIVGIGNCASAFLQGLTLYIEDENKHAGLMHREIAGISCADIEVVAVFDIDKRKVGKTLREAVFSKPNCVNNFSAGDIPSGETVVMMGPILDGCAPHMDEFDEDKAFRPSNELPVNVTAVLKESGAQVLVCYLPVGSDNAAKYYAQACIDAKVAMVNCLPSFIASDPVWEQKFKQAGIPIIGDDIKSQLGATIIHRTLTKLFNDRGIRLTKSYQLNTGGNTDFLNMLAKDRLKSKKISKTNSVVSQYDRELSDENIHIGPSDYIPWQKDNKICFLRMEGEGFADQPIEIEMRLSVQDSPNSAGIVIDAIRCAFLAKKLGRSGALDEACCWFMKSPPKQIADSQAKDLLEKFISEN